MDIFRYPMYNFQLQLEVLIWQLNTKDCLKQDRVADVQTINKISLKFSMQRELGTSKDRLSGTL